MMSELLRRGRAPSELVGWYAAEDARAGRPGDRAGRKDGGAT
jgi:hypothetical protein